MKLKNLFIAWGVLFSIQLVGAQNDTIWYDANWAITTVDDAAFFRPSPQPKDNGFWIEDFYISGAKQMEGFSKKKNRKVFDGPVTWYEENGNISQKANYQDGKLDGAFITYKKGEEATRLTYKNGKPQTGTYLYFNDTYQYYVFQEYKDGDLIKELMYEESPDTGIRIDIVYNHGENKVISKFYDKKGELVGKLSSLSKDPRTQKSYNGTYVNYYFKPMRVKNIVEFNEGSLVNKKIYYPSNELRENVTIKAGLAYITYYDKKGEVLGEFTTNFEPDQKEYNLYREPIDGTSIKFDKSQIKGVQYISNRTTYKNGRKTKQEEFYENGKLKSISIYDENTSYNNILKKETYSKEGEIKEKISYKDGKPYNGTITNPYKHTTSTYEEGVVVSEVKRYKNGKVFKKEAGNEAVFYDRNGEKLGDLKYKIDDYNYKKPYNGDEVQLGYNEQISSINSYKDGKRIRNVVFQKTTGPQGEALKQEEVFYNANRQKIRTKNYYSNGGLRSDFQYKGYSNIESAVFYKLNGEELSRINYYPKKEGTVYTFFNQSDSVQSIRTYKEGNLVYEKKYKKNYNETNNDPSIYLRSEIDYNGKAVFYNENEEILAQATYKDGKPWQGDIISGGVYQYKIIPYVNGIKEGEQIEYMSTIDKGLVMLNKKQYKNGQANGAFYLYRENGNIKKLEHYKDGKLDGEMIAYNEDGSERNKLIYKNGAAYEGLYVKFKKGYGDKPDITNKAYYKSGTLVKEERLKEQDGTEQLVREIFYKGNTLTGVEYNTSGQKIIAYNITDVGNKTGEIIYYDEEEAQEEKGILRNGRPVEGVFYLGNFYGKYNLIPEDDQIKSVKLEIQEDNTVLSALDANNRETFLIKESNDLKESYLLKEITESYYFYQDILQGAVN